MKTMTKRPRSEAASYSVGLINPKIAKAAREFTGRYELNGRWDIALATFHGSRPAVDQVRAFCQGWHAAKAEEML